MENKSFYWLTSLLLPLILLSSCTKAKIPSPADNAAIVTPSNVTSINGVVQLDRVRNASVKAYSLSLNGQIGTEVKGEATTNEKGEFQMNLPKGTGPVVLRSSGGKYDNEADGVETDSSELSNIIDPSQKTEAPLTPMTTLAKERILSLVEGGTDLEAAQASAKQQVAQVFGLSAEALDKLPAASNEVDATTDPDSMKSALALATLSEFMKAHFPNKTIEEVMAALVADFTTDGSINGDNQAGDLQNVFAQTLAFKWNTSKEAALAAAKLNPRLGFKNIDFNQVAGVSFEGESPLNKVYQDGVYYLGGVKTSLPESGMGLWNGVFYSAGEIGSGFFEGSCYLNGADTLAIISGKGFCSGDQIFYLENVATTLNEFGTGDYAGIYYESSTTFSGVHDGKLFQNGTPFSGETSGITYENGSKVNGVVGDRYFVEGVPSWQSGFADFSVDLAGNISAIKRDGESIVIQYGPINSPKVKVIDTALFGNGGNRTSIVRSRNGNYTAAFILNGGDIYVYVMDGAGTELKRFLLNENHPKNDSWFGQAISDTGRIAASWQSGGEDGNNYRLRLFNAHDSFDSGVIGIAADCGYGTQVALNPTNGSGVFTCQNHSGGAINFRLFDSSGNWTSDFTPATYQTSWYDSHIVAMNSNGEFVVGSTNWNGSSTHAIFFNALGTLISSVTYYDDNQGRYDTTRDLRLNINTDSQGNFSLPWMNPPGYYGLSSSGVSIFTSQGELIQHILHNGSEKFASDSASNHYYLVNGEIVREIAQLSNEGTLFTGLEESEQLYYLNGFPFSGLSEGIYYQGGIPFTGQNHLLQYYVNGTAATGVYDNVYYIDSFPVGTGFVSGVWYNSGYPGNGINDGIYYSEGLPATGAFGGWWWDQYPLACYTEGINTGEIVGGSGTCHSVYFVNYYRK